MPERKLWRKRKVAEEFTTSLLVSALVNRVRVVKHFVPFAAQVDHPHSSDPPIYLSTGILRLTSTCPSSRDISVLLMELRIAVINLSG